MHKLPHITKHSAKLLVYLYFSIVVPHFLFFKTRPNGSGEHHNTNYPLMRLV